MTTIPELDRFLKAEQRLYAGLGLTPRSTHVDVRHSRGTTKIRVIEIGPTDAYPLVWVHGGGSFGASLAGAVASVEARKPNAFRHIIIDRPGCGASDAFEYWDEPDLKTHATTVLRGVLDALDIEEAGFIGNSMGGLWSFWLQSDDTTSEQSEPPSPSKPSKAATKKQRRVSGLVMLGIPALFLDTSAPFPMRLCSVPWLGRRMMRMAPKQGAEGRAQAAQVLARLGHPDVMKAGILSNDFLDLMSAAGGLPDRTESFVSLIHKVLRIRGPRINFSMDEWKRVNVPVRFVWGDRDPFGAMRSAHAALIARPKTTTLDVVSGGGHLPWLNDVEVCAKAITSTFGDLAMTRARQSQATSSTVASP